MGGCGAQRRKPVGGCDAQRREGRWDGWRATATRSCVRETKTLRVAAAFKCGCGVQMWL